MGEKVDAEQNRQTVSEHALNSRDKWQNVPQGPYNRCVPAHFY